MPQFVLRCICDTYVLSFNKHLTISEKLQCAKMSHIADYMTDSIKKGRNTLYFMAK